MGQALSDQAQPPPPPKVILVPPRFYRDHHLLDAIFATPVDAWLNSPARRRLFAMSPPSGGSWGRIVMAPTSANGLVVLDASLSDTLRGQFSIRAYPLANQDGQGHKLTAAEFLAPIGPNAEQPILRASAFTPGGGFGGFAAASVDTILGGGGGGPGIAAPGAPPLPPGPDSGSLVGARAQNESFGGGVALQSHPTISGVQRDLKAWLMARAGALTVFAESAVTVPGAVPPKAEEIRRALRWGAAIQGPGWDAALVAAGGGEHLLGIYMHQVLRRRVRNPFESETVVGIANYVDLGVEVRFSTARPASQYQAAGSTPAVLDMAGSWQINKNWMVRGRLSSLGVAAAGVYARTWGTPGVSIGLTTTGIIQGQGGAVFRPSLSILVEDTGDVTYERPSKNATVSYPTLETVATGREVREGQGIRPMVVSIGREEGEREVGEANGLGAKGGVTIRMRREGESEAAQEGRKAPIGLGL